ncbi:UDP-Glycosyltransferase/glycogen phosphorylase [Trametopsis cervina]|nr:UDP-Glycosyltransferase/glycogen phosphorylase [Trametopsis cervina]
MASPEAQDQKPRTIVFISHGFSGHLNINLATIQYMLSLSPAESPPLHLHLLSFDNAERQAAARFASYLGQQQQQRHTFTFHAIGSFKQIIEETLTQNGNRIDRHAPPSLFTSGGLEPYRFLARIMGWKPDVYIALYERISEVLRSIGNEGKVDVAVVDVMMPMGEDACKTAGVRMGIVAPNSGLDLMRHKQPWLRGFWAMPALFTVTPFPIPLYLIPYNILLNLAFIYILATNPRIRALDAARTAAGIPGRHFGRPWDSLPFVICASVKELDFPHVSDRNLTYAGPILFPEPVLSREQYPELAAFFARRRTVVVNMGTLFWYGREDVQAFVEAIMRAREACKGRGEEPFQVLWKLKEKKEFEEVVDAMLGDASGDVRVEEWIEPPTLAVLQHPNVVAFVHHGGANSYNEACYAGVPQIILPQWADLYEYASRVEWLGNGIYANKRAPAKIDADELTDAFVRVLRDEKEGGALKRRAVEVRDACHGAGGAQAVAKVILGAASA